MNQINWDTAIENAGINATIERLTHYQKLMLIELLVCKYRPTLRFQTYNALEKLGLVRDRLTPGYWGYRWDELTADGMIAALRLLDPEYKDVSLFYELGKRRAGWEYAHREIVRMRSAK